MKYKGKTENILEVANRSKGIYALKFKDKNGRKIDVKISIIPIELCEFQDVPLNLVVVYGFGETPMMLITNLDSMINGYVSQSARCILCAGG